ncbi:bifunctional diaminohydroxyphosphoribosylaminopyrimidine deaminase/5-amino-6-(5-phosphoribosylamino)uracil reductase RibD [Truepera radiovictrix]|uniref:Riboflavin biosynthesis protein RibD n=1 Tax=Truepera radiovictrix (strain DSM 17093 / CIP 108686 / LMG 22925 / RQ-24) TaxID=649638 RepID=D7CR10_TRURR|nr:bifunctional diaminohydroxyphosphoribosylaminopyrimidine deaminase/5-amino-6-(5-phosphoribosylamino)uracil reductase RibD [Truepera radiovictrix]ADI13410.1 riboflavin biosynthesis protein RibD [Truepera radiovictrix DSM 17093]WMT58027.1 bifunctional diaminohydroxyphosphoribosylaminopyrimidine deaminase/5-amino-6-(5-phosphoribosylamino)uracil reductase RibD [Truepera radiovictrix]
MSGAATEPLAEHERYMSRALELAERGRGSTAPNPMVGCVIVRDDEIIGEGWHERAGEAHAEVRALQDARSRGARVRGATLYVTLEPCNHTGRTPPCTEAILEAGVRRVVIAALDPDPRVDGSGVARLQAAGVEVVTGVLAAEAEAQNEVFRTVHLRGRPWVLYKTAMTLDGKIATRTGRSRWITGPAARERVQRWRAHLSAVAVGVNTVLLDDPLLTCRVPGGHTPHKVVFDTVARTPPTAQLFHPDPQGEAARVTLFVTERAPAARVAALRYRGAEVVVLPETRGRADVRSALAHLKEVGVQTLLLEGGGTLAWSFFEVQAVDRVAVFIGPKLLGGGGASPLGGLGVTEMERAITLSGLTTEEVGGDLLVTGRVHYPEPADTPERELAREGA